MATLLWLHCYGYMFNRGQHAATVLPCPVTTHALRTSCRDSALLSCNHTRSHRAVTVPSCPVTTHTLGLPELAMPVEMPRLCCKHTRPKLGGTTPKAKGSQVRGLCSRTHRAVQLQAGQDAMSLLQHTPAG